MVTNKNQFQYINEEEFIYNLLQDLGFSIEEIKIRIHLLKDKSEENYNIRESVIKEIFIKFKKSRKANYNSILIHALCNLTDLSLNIIVGLYKTIYPENNN